MTPRWLGRSLLAACVVCLSACGGSEPEMMLEDYLYRLSNTLEVDIEVEDPLAAVPPLPRRRERRLELTDLRIGLLDFVTFYDCDLQRLVGERNSGLGKVMAASSRFVYESALLREVLLCRGRLQHDASKHSERLAQLQGIIEVKRAILPQALWNATVGGPEFDRFFSRAHDPGAAAPNGARVAFEQLARLARQTVSDPLTVDAAGLEPALEQLAANPVGGAALVETRLFTAYLNAAATVIEERLASRPVCFRQQASPRGQILHTVFRKYYVGRVQPRLARLHQELRGWLTPLQQLLETLGELQPDVVRDHLAGHWQMTAGTGDWQGLDRAITAHTKAWQQVLTQCGIMPGKTRLEGAKGSAN